LLFSTVVGFRPGGVAAAVADPPFPNDPERVVLFTLNQNLGDNIVFDYARIESIHARYPQAEIRVISPTSQILRETAWLKPLPFEVGDWLAPGSLNQLLDDPTRISRRLIHMIQSGIELPSLVIWEPKRFDIFGSDLLNVMIRQISTPEQFSRLGGPRSFSANLKYKISQEIGATRAALLARVSETGSKFLEVRIDPTLAIDRFNTAYDQSDAIWRNTFGDDARLAWNQDAYYDPARFDHSYRDAVRSSFKSSDGRFIVLNLNTRAEFKLPGLKKNYVARLEDLLDYLGRTQPALNLFVASPEAQFGEAVVAEGLKAIQKAQVAYPGRIATLPTDRELWKPILRDAYAVISQDSGMVHVANIFNPRVMSLSRSGADGSPLKWRLPGQAIGIYGSSAHSGNEPVHVPGLDRWLNETPCQTSQRAALSDLIR